MKLKSRVCASYRYKIEVTIHMSYLMSFSFGQGGVELGIKECWIQQ
jgi:hypothetical protein